MPPMTNIGSIDVELGSRSIKGSYQMLPGGCGRLGSKIISEPTQSVWVPNSSPLFLTLHDGLHLNRVLVFSNHDLFRYGHTVL